MHKQKLRENRHNSPHLQSSWNKYGKDSFIFEIIEYVEKDKTLIREQYWIDFYKSYDPKFGYNVNQNAKSWLGRHHTEETKKKLSVINKANPPKWTETWKLNFIKAISKPKPKGVHDGAKNPNAKLTSADVVLIRERIANGENLSKIGRDYGVSPNAIWDIKEGNSWRGK